MTGLDLHDIARALGGEVSGSQVLAPGLGHSHRDRSLALRLDARAPGGFLIHSFCGDNPLEAKDYVREKLSISAHLEKSVFANLMTQAGSPPTDAARTAQALAIWSEARDPRGTPVEAYFRGRALSLPQNAAGEAIRFHPACPFKRKSIPAMVCLVRDILTNEPKAVHRTALTLEGHKVKTEGHDRLSLGPIRGGAIKLTPDEDVTTCLGIGEGLESTLSLRLAREFGSSPVWCLLSTGGVGGFPLLSGVECLWVAVDHDPAGIKAATTCTERWCGAGCETFLVRPRSKHLDLNDIAKGERHYA